MDVQLTVRDEVGPNGLWIATNRSRHDVAAALGHHLDALTERSPATRELHHNGRAGMYGISYPGFYCSAGMIDAHPALKAVSPQAPVGDWFFDDFLHNGAFFLAHAYRWIGMNATERPKPTSERPPPLVYPTPDGYKLFLEAGNMEDVTKKLLKDPAPFWNDMVAHPNRDSFWNERAIIPHLKNVAPAVMVYIVDVKPAVVGVQGGGQRW